MCFSFPLSLHFLNKRNKGIQLYKKKKERKAITTKDLRTFANSSLKAWLPELDIRKSLTPCGWLWWLKRGTQHKQQRLLLTFGKEWKQIVSQTSRKEHTSVDPSVWDQWVVHWASGLKINVQFSSTLLWSSIAAAVGKFLVIILHYWKKSTKIHVLVPSRRTAHVHLWCPDGYHVLGKQFSTSVRNECQARMHGITLHKSLYPPCRTHLAQEKGFLKEDKSFLKRNTVLKCPKRKEQRNR